MRWAANFSKRSTRLAANISPWPSAAKRSAQAAPMPLLAPVMKIIDALSPSHYTCLMQRMFWVDLEMSGLDEKIHKILEVAVVVTDLDFKELETYEKIVYQPQEVLDAMDEWCTKTHKKSGLTKAVATGAPLETVEKELLELVARHYPDPKERVVLCGNSVGNDKRFIDAYMPKLAERLHYRIVDVSSYKEIFKSKWGVEYKKPDNHRALEDARASFEELKVYLSYVTPPVKNS